jgi:hypothetical protein
MRLQSYAEGVARLHRNEYVMCCLPTHFKKLCDAWLPDCQPYCLVATTGGVMLLDVGIDKGHVLAFPKTVPFRSAPRG